MCAQHSNVIILELLYKLKKYNWIQNNACTKHFPYRRSNLNELERAQFWTGTAGLDMITQPLCSGLSSFLEALPTCRISTSAAERCDWICSGNLAEAQKRTEQEGWTPRSRWAAREQRGCRQACRQQPSQMKHLKIGRLHLDYAGHGSCKWSSCKQNRIKSNIT